MARRLEAVYEQGILRPLKPLDLAEHQRVLVTLEERPTRLSWESPEPMNGRREELQWLAVGGPLWTSLGRAWPETGNRRRRR